MTDETVTMTKHELEAMQQACAQEGARLALASLGLDDKEAVHDIADLRDLLTAYRQAKNIVWQTVIKYVTMFILGAISVGVFFKMGQS